MLSNCGSPINMAQYLVKMFHMKRKRMFVIVFFLVNRVRFCFVTQYIMNPVQLFICNIM